jgi:hypothetical protein
MLKHVALFAWELPQNLLGMAWLAAETALGNVRGVEVKEARLVIESKTTAVSLGSFVFWTTGENRWFVLDERTRAHEWGHTFQSRLLGPLYLPLVGAPSVARVIYATLYREITGRRWQGYFNGYPEDWADRLGEVRRG